MKKPAMKLAGVGLLFAVVAVVAAGCNKEQDVASDTPRRVPTTRRSSFRRAPASS